MQIFKYEIPAPDKNFMSTLTIPNAFLFKILDVDTQTNPLDLREPMFLWAIIKQASVHKTVKLLVVPTGVEIPKNAGNFIKTVHFKSQRLVWHVFEVAE